MIRINKLLCLTVSAATADINVDEFQIEQKTYKIVSCQQNQILVLADEMCAEDLEKIANDKDIKVKRVVAKYDNVKLSTIEMLAKEKDFVVKKRLVENREVPNYIKDRLLKELSISTH